MAEKMAKAQRKAASEPLYGVFKEEFLNYEALRRSGRVNMYGARVFLGMDREEFVAILKHYREMATQWINQETEPQIEAACRVWRRSRRHGLDQGIRASPQLRYDGREGVAMPQEVERIYLERQSELLRKAQQFDALLAAARRTLDHPLLAGILPDDLVAQLRAAIEAAEREEP